MFFATALRYLFNATITLAALYASFLALLTVPYFQDNVIYLHKIALTWFQDVNYPEQWGFLHNQVTPFYLQTPDGERLHAWHILPLGLYHKHETELISEPSGLTDNVIERTSFKLLRDDPDALLVLYLHGAAGTLGSGFRPPSYRAISAGAPSKIHILAVDYRGFGTSSGWPSEDGLLTDALTLVDWARDMVGIPPERIVVFGQSIGTAVAMSTAHHLATIATPPAYFKGMILVAPFTDVERLTATYRLAGTIPLLSPLAHIPPLLRALNRLIKDKWYSSTKIAEFLSNCEQSKSSTARYDISIIHAKDDYDIHWSHSEHLFWHAVRGLENRNVTLDELEREKSLRKKDLGAGGWSIDWEGKKGVVRQQILEYGLHDRVMGYPVVSLAVLRAFGI